MFNLLWLKQGGASILILINLVLLVWAVVLYRRRAEIPDRFFPWLTTSTAVGLVTIAVGLYFLLEGRVATGRHLFYGIVVGVGVLGQLSLGARTSWGQKYRAKPLVYGITALWMLAAAARSWMSAL